MSKFTVDNDDLKAELVKYINSCEFKWVQDKKGNWKRKIERRGQISEKLGQMIKTIAEGLATKGNWRGYSWKADFVSYGILLALRYCHNFRADVSGNAHGYINRICSRAFLQYVQREKKHSYIKQELYEQKDYVQQNKWDKSINYEELKRKDFSGEE